MKLPLLFALFALAMIYSTPVVESAPTQAQERGWISSGYDLAKELYALTKRVYDMIQLFKDIDANGDGRVSMGEVQTGLLGMLDFMHEFMIKIIGMLNGNEDEDESATAEERMLDLGQSVDEMIELFKDIDTDGDGKISIEEVKVALNSDAIEQRSAAAQKRLLGLSSLIPDVNKVIEAIQNYKSINVDVKTNTDVNVALKNDEEDRSAPAEERFFSEVSDLANEIYDLTKKVYEMLKLFKGIDANGDGSISIDEVQAGLLGMLDFMHDFMIKIIGMMHNKDAEDGSAPAEERMRRLLNTPA